MLKRIVAVACLLLASLPVARSQVVIREKMVINPRPAAQISAAAVNDDHSLRVVFSANSPILLRLIVNRTCGDPLNDGLPYVGTQQIEVNLETATIGYYEFNAQTRVAEIPLGQTVTVTFSLYTGGELAYQAQEEYTGGSGGTDVFAVWYPKYEFLPFAYGLSNYALSNCVKAGDQTTLAVVASAGCSREIRWSPERDLITFRVIQGSDLGELRDRMGNSLGSEAQLKLDDAVNIKFAANEDLEDGGPVQIEATVGDLRSVASLTVFTDKDLALALSSYGTDVQHGEQIELVGRTIACGGSTAIPSSDLTFTFEIIDGEEWGRLYYEGTGLSGDALEKIPHHNGEARIWFQAWEESPTEPKQVTVEMLASDPDIPPVTLNLSVTPGGLKIVAAPPTLAYGEKSTITVQKLLPDGTTEPLSPEATITYRIVDGMTAGTLQNADSSEYGDEILTNESQWLFASKEEEPQPDEVEVIVQIEVEEGIIIILGADGQEGPGLQANASKEGQQQITGEKTASTSTFYGLSGVAKIVVKKNNEANLVLLKPKENSPNERITSEPKMPGTKAEAKLENFTGGTVQYQWKLTVRWTGPDSRKFNDDFSGTTQTSNDQTSAWLVNWGGKTRGGDDNVIEVKAVAGSKTFSKSIKKPFKILGDNPTIAEVKAGLTLQEQVVVYLESRPKWKHFNTAGFPIWGKPHGYGLMQLDRIDPTGRHPTDEEVWNWKSNRAAGRGVLQFKLALARRYGSDVRAGNVYGRDGIPNHPAPANWYRNPATAKPIAYRRASDLSTDEQLWKEAFHRYRGGIYWRWVAAIPGYPNSGGRWVAAPTKGHTRGTEAWNLYTEIQSGTTPSNWN